MTLKLTTGVRDLPGVDAVLAQDLTRMGLRCLADLVLHLPTRYHLTRPWQPIAEVIDGLDGSDMADVEIRGEVVSVDRGFGRKSKIEAEVEDESGRVHLVFFNQPWVQRTLAPGIRVQATGRPRAYRNQIQIANPTWSRIEDDAPLHPPRDRDTLGALEPVYRASEAVSSAVIAGLIESILEDAVALIDDHLPEAYRTARNLPSLAEAYRLIHRPSFDEHIDVARRRLAFDELLLLQLGVMMKRHHRRTHLHAPALADTPDVRSRIAARIPFDLTPAQQRVVDEIAVDLGGTVPMNRLLQGDVGSGKTVVALAAMLFAVAHGRQAALLAPTELLAEQHARTLEELLAGSRVRMTLLTGSISPSRRRETVESIGQGDADIVVGTHAVLTSDVIFDDLAVAVADEQHRFGVHQRAALRDKTGDATRSPHQLVMTATPIPRTLSLTIFGDLDVSIIDEMPAGRSAVTTVHVSRSEAGAAYEDIAIRVRNDERAFIVVPVIDESDTGLTDLNSHLERLSSGPLSSCALAAMHGRLSADERDAVMARFRTGEINVLVATTVVEVGVDIPEATVMVIEDADRFGLAQLHQLRGRVGRGALPGRCVLVSDPTTEEGRRRIEALVETSDGFRIAERDLEIRGPGELFGAKQSGMPPFRVAVLPRDLELLSMARRDATDWIQRDPLLDADEHALLHSRLHKAHGQWLGLGDVG